MIATNNWALLHDYQAKAELGLVPAILCPDDEAPCVGYANPENGEPALRCIECNSVFRIGLHVFEQMKANLREID